MNNIKIMLLLFLCPTCWADMDVNDIRIEGDSTLAGMKIERFSCSEGNILIETTGARFEYVKGQLKLYQGLDAKNRRLLSTITFDSEPAFIKVEDNNDHILFWSKDLNIGVYGDSTCILYPKRKLQINCKGDFQAEYEGVYKGEVFLADQFGGMEIYPQRYEKGYDVSTIELGKKAWIVNYILNDGERVMLAAFPGRIFDWEKSFGSKMLILQSNVGRGSTPDPSLDMVPDYALEQWSKYINVIVPWYKITYVNSVFGGPYVIANENAVKRVINTCKRVNVNVIAYVSHFEYYRKYGNTATLNTRIKELKDTYGFNGVYIDGLRFDIDGEHNDNKIDNWSSIRYLRQLFGKDGTIILHETHGGRPTEIVPNLESYCDVTINGENIPFKKVTDPYIRYHVRKYGISNTPVALWMPGPHPASIGKRDISDAMLAMNGRDFWWGGGLRNGPNLSGWVAGPHLDYMYYLKKLNALEAAWKQPKLKKGLALPGYNTQNVLPKP